MIAVDTSALMAILLDEPAADACIAALETADEILMSAGTVTEALIVSARRHVGEAMTSLVDGLGLEVVPVTATSARASRRLMSDGGKA
ncbi:MAG TPA: type II toxin-antitoxin system VapC family toxin [Lamprocystis sp. (in: g-proteobacteria)]|nr:type II toxin-antitoxin system VapC family toxin [Lamprocystis sp. (in: g-proteobacteria)]